MRLIGKLESERAARRFGDYLLVRGIDNRVDPGTAGDWEIWIVEDEKLREAGDAFARYTENPQSDEFNAARDASRIRKEADREARESRGRVVDMRTHMHVEQMAFKMPVTAGLIGLSVIVAFLSGLGRSSRALQPFMIVPFRVYLENLQASPLAAVLKQGEVWRIVTPIFIHYGIMHIVFNMMWMVDLGRMIEPKRGSLYMALLVLLIAIPSNLLEYMHSGPGFGGMSGVVFGLIGYMWIYNKFTYRDNYPLDPQSINLSLVWFVICILGWVGPIANWAHGGGLAVGMLWGFLRSDRFKRLVGA